MQKDALPPRADSRNPSLNHGRRSHRSRLGNLKTWTACQFREECLKRIRAAILTNVDLEMLMCRKSERLEATSDLGRTPIADNENSDVLFHWRSPPGRYLADKLSGGLWVA
nr:hypothetical protein [Microvirga alba]